MIVLSEYILICLLLNWATISGFKSLFYTHQHNHHYFHQRLVKAQAHAIGIDLGTTYSLVSAIENGKPRLLQVDGEFLVPSIVSYTNDNKVLVGKAAKNRMLIDPRNTFSSAKRLIGRSMKQAKSSGDFGQFGNKRLVSTKDDVSGDEMVMFDCPNLKRPVSPIEISSHILRHMINAAKDYFQEPITKAVITVPAYFTMDQKEATKRAGEMAGLEKVQLLTEPEAAAFAFGLDKKQSQLVLVFDLGGGTFDVSILDVGDGMAEIIATSGDNHLGGDDFDQLIVDWVLRELKNDDLAGKIKSNIRQSRKLRSICTQSKIILSKNTSISIDLSTIDGCDGKQFTLTRKKFNSLANPLLSRLMRPLREVALMAGVNLPGESGLLSEYNEVEDEENTSSVDFSSPVDFDYDAIQQLKSIQVSGRKQAKKRQEVKGVVGKEIKRLQKELADPSLLRFPGGKGIHNVILVGGATRMPCIVNLVKTITHIEPKRYINPDEAVCLGAGIMAGVLEGSLDNLLIINPVQAALLRLVAETEKPGNISSRSTSQPKVDSKTNLINVKHGS